MNTPKILPWLAHKAGISDARAEELWREAICHATANTEWVGSARFWQVAVDRAVELIRAEAAAQQRRISPFVRLQARLWMMPVIAWEAAALFGNAAFASLFRRAGRPPRQRLHA